MTHKFEMPKRVVSDSQGFETLNDFYNQTKNAFIDTIVIDFSNTDWFDANLLAMLGAILSRLEENLNSINIINLKNRLEKIFSKNHFLSNFGGYKIEDYYQTTIKYKKIKPNEEKVFKYYLDNELLSKTVLPKMSTGLRKKINESIFEIFNNAIIHGESSDIFSCGQYYPRGSKLDFTIVDLGKTIKVNVNKYLNKNLKGSQAIDWAVQEGNTTKVGDTPGGLGLSLIRDFLKLNNGKIQIRSCDGYWCQAGNQINQISFDKEFDGTIVNLEFNLNDKSLYYLKSELKPEDIL
ncbi:MAG: ATP-binding protein [Bacteroidetes bacterium]|nr:ATP-binding protein [Bacteroidota bacterium]MBU2583776.1 ATP-binding protein [Bacteroidota bacterium]